MKITASEMAKYLLRYFWDKNQPISNLKLQKLLYYCQGWHLGISKSPIFHEQIQAWIHGPVVPSVFQEYRQFRWSPIVIDTGKAIRLPASSAALVDAVLVAYGDFTATQLEQLSHGEDPWKFARQGIAADCPCTREITHASMREYFAHLAGE